MDAFDGFTLSGFASSVTGGLSVSSAGDFNGDGFDDLVLGAVSGDELGANRGIAYVVFGKPGGPAADFSLSTLDGTNGFRFTGSTLFDGAETSVSGLGDFNGDGYDDIVVGSPGILDGRVTPVSACVIFGRPNAGEANLDARELNGGNGFLLDGTSDGSQGNSVGAAGDINHDGFADLIIGAPGRDEGGSIDRGAAYVVFGKKGPFPSVSLLSMNAGNGFKILGLVNFDQFGSAVGSAGDVNGDGIDDLFIGAPGADEGGTDRGAAYVIFGRTRGFGSEFSLLNLQDLEGIHGVRISGASDNECLGLSVCSAGDVNGDGLDDIVIGTFRHPAALMISVSRFHPAWAPDRALSLSGESGISTAMGLEISS